jgi:hypothetical protein
LDWGHLKGDFGDHHLPSHRRKGQAAGTEEAILKATLTMFSLYFDGFHADEDAQSVTELRD